MKQTKQAFTHFFYSASNSIHENQKNESGWLNLVQYGNYLHEKGIQIFNTESAKVLINHFKSLKARLLRAFGGIPIFIGHPDDSSFNNQSGHQDTRAYAWIIDMKQDDKGLWILPRWSQAGKEILENAFYNFYHLDG